MVFPARRQAEFSLQIRVVEPSSFSLIMLIVRVLQVFVNFPDWRPIIYN